jgi:hypothetical protein
VFFRVEGNGIRFPEGVDDPAALIELIQRVLGARLRRRRFLTFSFGVEFELEGEKLPMMIDSDGWAFLDCRDNSARVRELILRRVLLSGEFCEHRAPAAQAAG